MWTYQIRNKYLGKRRKSVLLAGWWVGWFMCVCLCVRRYNKNILTVSNKKIRFSRLPNIAFASKQMLFFFFIFFIFILLLLHHPSLSFGRWRLCVPIPEFPKKKTTTWKGKKCFRNATYATQFHVLVVIAVNRHRLLFVAVVVIL